MTDPWDERYIYLVIYHKIQPNVGKYAIHGWCGLYVICPFLGLLFFKDTHHKLGVQNDGSSFVFCGV